MEGIATKLFGYVILSHNDHLSMRLSEMRHGQRVGSGEHPVFLCAAGEDFKSLFSQLAIGGFVSIGMQTQQRNCRGWIARGRGRILKRLPPRAQNAERTPLSGEFTRPCIRNVEEASRT